MTLIVMTILGLVAGYSSRLIAPRLLKMSPEDFEYSLPLAEFFGALSFFLLAKGLGAEMAQWKWYLFLWILLTISTADAVTKYIPTLLCYVGTPLGILLNGLFPEDILDLAEQYNLLTLFGIAPHESHIGGVALAISGAVMGFCVIEFIRRIFRPLVKMEAMGFGDVLLMMMIGAFIGPKAVIYTLLPASLIGIIIGGIRLVVLRVHHSAFGPALAAGSVIILLYSNHLVNAYAVFQQALYNMPPLALLSFSVVLVLVLLWLLLRLKRKSAMIEEALEAEYAETDKKIKSS